MKLENPQNDDQLFSPPAADGRRSGAVELENQEIAEQLERHPNRRRSHKQNREIGKTERC